jgi:hypothetical protein
MREYNKTYYNINRESRMLEMSEYNKSHYIPRPKKEKPPKAVKAPKEPKPPKEPKQPKVKKEAKPKKEPKVVPTLSFAKGNFELSFQ